MPFCGYWKSKRTKKLNVSDSLLNDDVVNMDLDILLGNPPKLKKVIQKPNDIVTKEPKLMKKIS